MIPADAGQACLGEAFTYTLLSRNITMVVATVVLRKPHRAAAKDGPVASIMALEPRTELALDWVAEAFMGVDLQGSESRAACSDL